MEDSMKPMVKDYHKPADAYAEKFDQAPLAYMERNDKQEKQAAKDLKKQAYKGRYDK